MKPKILLINSVCGFGSTGRIVADLSKLDNYETLVCYGRKKDYASVNSYKFANFFDNAFGAIRTILFDNNLKICSRATKKLINKIKKYNPDIIHIHNLHGYYVNVEMLMNFLKEYNKPVVLTLHDCWSFTGYCPHFDGIQCEKYKTKCEKCPHGFSYPFSLFKQGVVNDYYLKKDLLNKIENITFVCPSEWLKNKVSESILSNGKCIVINNGIDLQRFNNEVKKNERFTVLALANQWTKEKGSDDINKLIPLLNKNVDLICVGKGSNKFNCQHFEYVDDVQKLTKLYSSSHVLINPTYEDNFPTINIESLACGTPVITYNTGGSPEIIDKDTGIIIEKGNYQLMADAINKLSYNYSFDASKCVERSKKYDKNIMMERYKNLYEGLLDK